MDIRIYNRSKMASDGYSSTVDRAPGADFSQILTHSVAGHGRQGESDRHKDRIQDVLRQKLKDTSQVEYRPVGVHELPSETAQHFYQVRLQYGIPVPPEELSFDEEGELILSDDYPYALQMKQAFNENPELRQMILDHSAQAVSYDEVQDSMPFDDMDNDEVAKARFDQMMMMTRLKQTG